MQLRTEDLRATPAVGVTCAAVAAHISSWALPVIDGYRGWQAFRVALTPIVAYQDFSSGTIWYERVLSVASGLTNLLFVAALAAFVGAPAGWLRASRWALLGAALLNLYWVVMMGDDREELGFGYYVWIGSFLLLAVAAHLRSRSEVR